MILFVPLEMFSVFRYGRAEAVLFAGTRGALYGKATFCDSSFFVKIKRCRKYHLHKIYMSLCARGGGRKSVRRVKGLCLCLSTSKTRIHVHFRQIERERESERARERASERARERERERERERP